MWRFSNSHEAALKFCPRYLYLSYYLGGTGMRLHTLDQEMATGTLVHSFLSQGLRGEAFSANMEHVTELSLDAIERVQLAEALARAWLRVRLPRLLERFEIEYVEKEVNVPVAPGIELMVRADAVLRSKDTGEGWALEFKTIGTVRDAYLDRWYYDPQTLTHLLAMPKPGGVLMEFLWKGRKTRDGKFESKLLPPPGVTVRDWVARLPEEDVWASLFTREIARNEREIADWLRQAEWQQRRVQTGVLGLAAAKTEEERDELLALYFPGLFNQTCAADRFGKKCAVFDVCWRGVDPLESGLYAKREPHHAQEFEA